MPEVMSDEHSHKTPVQPPPGWTIPHPEELPEPSFWPAALSLASTLLVWGLISSVIISGVGLVMFIGSVAGWIAEIRHERKQHERAEH